jgi:hypothetical protein
VNTELCQKQAQLLHPGQIEKERMQDRRGHFLVAYEIQAPNGKEWQALCDLRSGKLLQE